MNGIKYSVSPIEIISPHDSNYFFGYYDINPWSEDGSLYLCHKIAFLDRLPLAEDVAELGAIDMKTGDFMRFSQTSAWNFQQGSFLRWYADKEIIYNIRNGNNAAAEIKNIQTGASKNLPLPIADYSKNKNLALSLNFNRIYDFRSGYGYASMPDLNAKINAPTDDGLWLMDCDSGESELLITYDRLKNEFPYLPYSDEKLVINHANFNPSGTAFVFLLRNFPTSKHSWSTLLLVSDLKGNVQKLNGYCTNSHYHWKNDRELLIFAGDSEAEQCLILFDVTTGESEKISHPLLKKDIHCNYSPCRRYILGDGYPDGECYRTLFLYDTITKNCDILAKVYSLPADPKDIRCDLHARWNPDGKGVTFDSTHTGKRSICRMNIF